MDSLFSHHDGMSRFLERILGSRGIRWELVDRVTGGVDLFEFASHLSALAAGDPSRAALAINSAIPGMKLNQEEIDDLHRLFGAHRRRRRLHTSSAPRAERRSRPSLPTKLSAIRRGLGLDRAEVARRLKCSERDVELLEDEGVPNCDRPVRLFARFARVFGPHVHDLLSDQPVNPAHIELFRAELGDETNALALRDVEDEAAQTLAVVAPSANVEELAAVCDQIEFEFVQNLRDVSNSEKRFRSQRRYRPSELDLLSMLAAIRARNH